mmetsp:Transcript_118741/g.378670  ORF Transcript_118741/g.378670 Transcript_118741/m.378670 type:complete len:279 (+) Transcript_118741:2079-2915(+)
MGRFDEVEKQALKFCPGRGRADLAGGGVELARPKEEQVCDPTEVTHGNLLGRQPRHRGVIAILLPHPLHLRRQRRARPCRGAPPLVARREAVDVPKERDLPGAVPVPDGRHALQRAEPVRCGFVQATLQAACGAVQREHIVHLRSGIGGVAHASSNVRRAARQARAEQWMRTVGAITRTRASGLTDQEAAEDELLIIHKRLPHRDLLPRIACEVALIVRPGPVALGAGRHQVVVHPEERAPRTDHAARVHVSGGRGRGRTAREPPLLVLNCADAAQPT